MTQFMAVGSVVATDGSRKKYATPETRRRYRRLFPMGIEPFSRQNTYPPQGLPWVPARTAFSEVDLDRHLDPAEDFWLASRAPFDARGFYTHFLMLDFDAKGDPEPPDRRLERVIGLLGVKPLVFTSPGNGYHAFWFLDQPTRVGNLTYRGRSHLRGLVPRLVGRALGRGPGQGIVEVFPQAGRIMRWPLGNRQELVDLETWQPEVGLSPEEKLDAAEAYFETGERLSYQHLRRLDESLPMPSPGPSRQASNEPEPEIDRDLAVRLWSEGLQDEGTRDSSTFLLALVLVHEPELLGFVGVGGADDPAALLADWMEHKHNGLSKTLASFEAGDPWFLCEARRVVDAARKTSFTHGFHPVDPAPGGHPNSPPPGHPKIPHLREPVAP